ncbi:MAG: molecular chaperone HtpG [Candidatus Omnitrophica bacterium]|nr:molecular chaperone HtpG [Candidatus Omnitrophota bacterium]
MDENKQAQQYEYKAEMKKLLGIIIHSLYTHPEVFLRELISNASDALNKVRFRELTEKNITDAGTELKITIQVDSKQKTFSIEDTGIGMTEAELINNIGTIARSGTLEFLKDSKEKQKSLEEDLIGKFGVGFYSTFMVANEVVVETRSAEPDSKGYRWSSCGEGSFTIEEIDRKARGTKIYFTLKKDHEEFAEEYKIRSTIEKYSNFADFPIFLAKEKVNKVEALWRKKPQDMKEDELNEFYKFISNDFEEPFGHLPVSVEGSVVSFKALLFIPKNPPTDLFRVYEEKGLSLYSNKILIQNDCKELLPMYLRFVKGVVDTIDLPLNVSREVTQSSPLLSKIRSILTSKILGFFDEWSKKDKDKYLIFYKNFGTMLKAALNEDFENRDKIIDLFRFETSLKGKGEYVSLADYVSGMKPDQKDIYYISGENRGELERNPNLEYFRKKGIEVIFLTTPADIFTVPSLGEYDKKPLKSVEKSDIDMDPADKIEKPENELSKSLVGLFKDVLKGKVQDVVISKRLVDSPVTLVTAKDGMDREMEKMLKAMNRGGDIPASKRVMEVNAEHPLIKNLSRLYMGDSSSPLVKKCMVQLYEGALLIEGSLPSSADFVARMNEIIQEATK